MFHPFSKIQIDFNQDNQVRSPQTQELKIVECITFEILMLQRSPCPCLGDDE